MKILPIDDLNKVIAIAAEELGPNGSIEQIERYAQGVVSKIAELRFSTSTPVIIFAGSGGNGADALAVARLLAEAGYTKQDVFLFNIKGHGLSDNCRRQRDRLLRQGIVKLTEISDSMDSPGLTASHLVIDGLFGTGLRDKMPRGFAMLAHVINDSGATVVSLDVPSGLLPDWNPTMVLRDVVNATYTMGCGAPHLAYFSPDAAPVCGECFTIDIGLSANSFRKVQTNLYVMEADYLRRTLLPRAPFTTKEDYGSALLVAGSYGMVGAAVLSAKGALRSGAGKITVHSPRCSMVILQTSVPEAMFRADKNDLFVTEAGSASQRLDGFSAIGLGPGLGHREDTVNAVETLLKTYRGPMVIDADALNCIAMRRTLLNHLTSNTIITPHSAEFDRLFGESNTGEERLLKAVEQAAKYRIIIVLKHHHTAIVMPNGNIYFNATGNAGMATPGSGDVLTGVVTSFLAQGYHADISAIAAVYVHGLAGDMALKKSHTWSLSAGDIAEALPAAFANIIPS